MRLVAGLTLAVSLAFALVTAGCGASTPTTPTPVAPTITETFNGTLTQHGSNAHTFTVGQIGEVDATLTTVAGPVPTIALGFILGQWDGTNCNPGFENDNSRQGTVLSGTTTSTGTFCVRVWDVGNIAPDATYTYTVTVLHP